MRDGEALVDDAVAVRLDGRGELPRRRRRRRGRRVPDSVPKSTPIAYLATIRRLQLWLRRRWRTALGCVRTCRSAGTPLSFPITFTVHDTVAVDRCRGKPRPAAIRGSTSCTSTARITIKEIARMCGVSTQTVSRVINKRPDVSPQTREAVEAAIAATGFQPSAVARSLVQRRSQTLGVVVAGLRYFGVAQTLNGITEEAQAAGYGAPAQGDRQHRNGRHRAGHRLHDGAPGRGHHLRRSPDRRPTSRPRARSCRARRRRWSS